MPTLPVRGTLLVSLFASLAPACGTDGAGGGAAPGAGGAPSGGGAGVFGSTGGAANGAGGVSGGGGSAGAPGSAGGVMAVDGGSVGDASAGGAPPTGDGGSTVTCWPWQQPTTAALRASSKKVFAHYFSPYPLSLDNQPPATDYYARNYLKPDGESGKHAAYGGFLRERPLPRDPYPAGVDYALEDMKTEVRRAVAIGLDGFTYDVLNPTPGQVHRTRLDTLLAAAKAVDPGFVVQLVPDMTTTVFGGTAGGTDAAALDALRVLLDAVGGHPSVQRLGDGRIVLSPFAAERRSAAFWKDAMTKLAEAGHPVALVPMPVGSWAGAASGFDGVTLYGASSWGTRTLSGGTALEAVPAQVHAQGLLWMAPVAPQDSRPKNLNFVESNNSRAYVAEWKSAIAGGADWVQVITWNDYSEDSEISPSSQTGTGFYDLAAYYTAWFKRGSAPPLERDGLYYFHRAHSMDPAVAPPDLTKQEKAMAAVNGPSTSTNEIELVGLLTEPGTLRIVVNGHTYSEDAPAGMTSFRVALEPGTPVFSLVRAGKTVLELTSATPVDNAITYQDPLYHAGATPTCAP